MERDIEGPWVQRAIILWSPLVVRPLLALLLSVGYRLLQSLEVSLWSVVGIEKGMTVEVWDAETGVRSTVFVQPVLGDGCAT